MYLNIGVYCMVFELEAVEDKKVQKKTEKQAISRFLRSISP